MAAADADADDRENIDPLCGHAVDAPPPPSDAKEKSDLYSNCHISPKSPLPIPGESKDPHSDGISNPANTSGNGQESNNTVKKRNVFRPSVFDRQTRHHDHGYSDDMESNSGSYQNRWKKNDEESSVMNKTGLPTDGSRNRLDSHCHPPEHWENSTSKVGNNDQRRDDKGNFFCGPTDKGSEHWRDKRADSGKQNDASHEKVFSHDNNPMKDAESDSNISRSWNSSYLKNHSTRGTYDHPSHALQKSSSSLGYSRERQQSENLNLTSYHRRFTPGTSRVSSGSSRPFHIGVVSNRLGAASRDSLSYSRMKLLEIYSKNDVRNFVMALPDSDETSLLWHEDPAEPFALIAHSAEEVAILKGIEQGEITNSDEQASKNDGREDLAGSIEDIKGIVTENMKGECEIVDHMQPCPENLSLYYKDPHGQTQGPFSESQIIDWFEAGYFGVDLLVSVSNSSPHAPFQLLGDVIPHLREKSMSPPGFNNLRPSSMLEPSHFGSAYLGISDNGSINRNDSVTEAKNVFRQYPMSSKIQNLRAETSCATRAMNERSNNTFENNIICDSGNVNGIKYHVAQKALLERENTFQTEGGVISAAQAQKDTVQYSHAKWFPQMVAPSSETLQSPVFACKIVPAEKHQAPTVNSGLKLWPGNVKSESVDLAERSLSVDHNVHNSQQIGIDLQQHHSLTQNQPTLAFLNSQIMHPARSEISQDRLSSNIIQHQYPLQPSLQPQEPAMPQPQASLFSNMRQLRQQEQHLSRVLPDGGSAQLFHDPYGPKNTSVSGDSMKLCIQRTQEILERATMLSGHAMYGIQLPDDSSAKMRETNVLGFSESRVPSLPLPHEIIGHTPRRECFANLAHREGSVNEVSQQGITNSSFKKTTAWYNEVSKLSAVEANGFPEPCQSHAKSETVLSNISNQMKISSINRRTWKLTPSIRPKPLMEIQAEEQLKAKRELSIENAKVTVAAAPVSSIPLSTTAKSSEQLFGNAARSMGDLEKVNISRSTRSQSHGLLTEKKLVKSNDRDPATVDAHAESFHPLVPYITQSSAHSHEYIDLVGVQNSRKERSKEHKLKGSAVHPPTRCSFDPSMISMPIKKHGKQVQKAKEVFHSQSIGPSQTEAMEFKEWCKNEWTKLTGTNDIGFLEFCIKQPASEAEMLLLDNIGFLDHSRNFIDKFLSYKAFLSADVIDMAFGASVSPEPRVESPRPGSLGA